MLRNTKLALLLAAISAASMWFYVQRVLIPYERADAALYGRPRGNLSDLYPRWLGARELLLHRRDPYSPQITREIQEGYYGRAIDPSRPYDPKDQQGFAYPLYVVFLLAPTVFLPFAVVQSGFFWTLIALSAAAVVMWLRLLNWRISGTTTAALIVLSLGSFPAVQGFKLEQLSLLVCGLLAGSALFLARGRLFLAGFLLALATIKPQLALPFAGWLLLWALARWRERKNFVWGFGGTMAALWAGSEILLPGWMHRFREAVKAYQQYTGGAGSALDVLIGPLITATGVKLLATAIVLGTIAVCWRVRRESAASAQFNLATSLVLAATVVIIPTFAPYNQLLLLPAIFLLLQNRGDLCRGSWLIKVCAALCAFVILWPWLATVSLTLASGMLPAAQVQKAWQLPLYTSLEIPFAVLALLTLYIPGKLASGRRAALAD